MSRADAIYTVIGLMLVGVCVFGDLNTRIGWPGICLSHGMGIAMAYVAMGLSLGIASALMAWSARTGKPCCLGLVLVLLIVAATTLQWLPRSPTGIQFLPVSPWAFSTWMPFLLSLISWLFVGLVFLALVYQDRSYAVALFRQLGQC